MKSTCSICRTHRAEPGVGLEGDRFWAYLQRRRCVLKEVASTLSGEDKQGTIRKDALTQIRSVATLGSIILSILLHPLESRRDSSRPEPSRKIWQGVVVHTCDPSVYHRPTGGLQ